MGIPLNLENDTKKRVHDDVMFYDSRKSVIFLGKRLKNTKGGGVVFCCCCFLMGEEAK